MYLSILKFISIVLSGILGMYASVTNFRNDNNKVTKGGRLTFLGVLISAILAGVLQIYSDSIEDKQNELLLQKNNDILIEVQKTLNPLEDLAVKYTLEPNWEHKNFKNCFNEIESKKTSNVLFPGTFSGGTYLREYTKCDSVNELLVLLNVNLYFFQEELSDSILSSADIFNMNADLILTTYHPDNLSYPIQEKVSDGDIADIFYKGENEKLSEIKYTKEIIIDSQNEFNWIGTNNFKSTLDFQNSNLYIELMSTTQIIEGEEDFDEKEKIHFDMLKNIKLTQLSLRTKNGTQIILDRNQLEYIGLRGNSPIYHFIFPDKLDEIINTNPFDE